MYTTDSEWAYVMNYKHYCEIEDEKEKFIEDKEYFRNRKRPLMAAD